MSDEDTNWEATGDNDGNYDIVLDHAPVKQKLKPPPMYAVVMLNDDFTPMDFVVAVLVNMFRKSSDEAEAIMMDIHKKGKGIAGIFTKDIAETKVRQVNSVAQQQKHPFLCQVEPT